MMAILAMVPRSVWIGLAAAALLLGAAGYIDHRADARGAARIQVKWDAERVENARIIAALRDKQAAVVEKVVVRYRDRIQIVKEEGDAIVREIPALLPLNSPLLSGTVRMLHDAAATGALPGDPGGAAAAAAPVETAALITGVAENYAACRANAEQLIALQQIVKGASP